jgi:hypothetical protein
MDDFDADGWFDRRRIDLGQVQHDSQFSSLLDEPAGFGEGEAVLVVV